VEVVGAGRTTTTTELGAAAATPMDGVRRCGAVSRATAGRGTLAPPGTTVRGNAQETIVMGGVGLLKAWPSKWPRLRSVLRRHLLCCSGLCLRPLLQSLCPLCSRRYSWLSLCRRFQRHCLLLIRSHSQLRWTLRSRCCSWRIRSHPCLFPCRTPPTRKLSWRSACHVTGGLELLG
jgi:hypothetical protein